MKQYKKPEFHFARNMGQLSGKDIAGLSEEELAGYLGSDSFKEQNRRYRIRSGYILREIAGEYAIVPVDDESLFNNAVMAPNDTAVFLWKAFEQPSTIEDVVVKGMQEYEAAEEQIRKSTEHFVKESLKYKILEEVE